LLSATPFLTDGYRQPIRISVLRDLRAKHFLWLLNAVDISFDHPLMKFVEIGNTQTRTAPSGGKIVSIRTRGLACVQR
jgi:hypothetical protein